MSTGMFNQGNSHIISHNQQLPILNWYDSTNVCGPCHLSYRYQLPNKVDFMNPPYAQSSRIEKIYVHKSGLWKFKNFKGEAYFGLKDSSIWYYQLEGSVPGRMCQFHALEVEKIYGLFLPPFNSEFSWIYYGYEKDTSQNQSCFIKFSEEMYYLKRTDLTPHDQHLPVQKLSDSTNDCGPCRLPYRLQLPNKADFLNIAHPQSTRIATFYLHKSGLWKFKNYKKEVYFRVKTSPVWYYRFEGKVLGRMCLPHAAEVENIYGLFLPPCNGESLWIYYGYGKYMFPNRSCFIKFSEELFNLKRTDLTLPNTVELMDTSEAPPVVQQTDSTPDLMDIDKSIRCEQESQQDPGSMSIPLVINPPPGFENHLNNVASSVNPSFAQNNTYSFSGLPCHTKTNITHNLVPSNSLNGNANISNRSYALYQPKTDALSLLISSNTQNNRSCSPSLANTNWKQKHQCPPKPAFQKEILPDSKDPWCEKGDPRTDVIIPNTDMAQVDASLSNFDNAGSVYQQENTNISTTNTSLNCSESNNQTNASTSEHENRLERNSASKLKCDGTNDTHTNLSTTTHHVESKPAGTECNARNENPVDTSPVSNTHSSNENQLTNDLLQEKGINSVSEQSKICLLKPEPNTHTEHNSKPIESQTLNSDSPQTDFSKSEILPLKVNSNLPPNNGESNMEETRKLLDNYSSQKSPLTVNSNPDDISRIEIPIQKTDPRTKENCIHSRSPGKSNSVSTAESRKGVSNRQNVGLSAAQKAKSAFKDLRDVYQAQYKRLPTSEFRTPVDFEKDILELYDLTVLVQDKATKKAKRCEMIIERKSTHLRRILVQAEAGFGKTVLCDLLAYKWARTCKDKSFFQLCMYIPLTFMENDKDLSSLVITACSSVLGRSEHGTEVIKKALIDNSTNILLLLDDYEKLSEYLKKKVVNFLQSCPVFRSSTIVITTRPVQSECDFLNLFDKHVFIHGSSEKYIEKLLNSSDSERKTIQLFLHNFKPKKLDFLYELPPYFASYISKTVNANINNAKNCQSLYTLLESVFCYILAVNRRTDSSVPERKDVYILFQLLGNMFFHALAVDQRCFTKNDLSERFGEQLKYFVNWNIVYKQTRLDEDKPLMFTASKFIMVFFATMYLRTQWSNLSNDHERFQFLQNVFCGGCCTGDYATGEYNRTYYFGLIPEIVLSVDKGQTLDKGTFEMYYDLEAVEYSRVFESVNVLTRISDKYLGRYGFQIKSNEDESFLNTFIDIIDSMSVDNCLVNYRFYDNQYEGKHFMKMDIQSTGETKHTVILRANNNKAVDRMYIDFVYSEFGDLFDIVRKLLSNFVQNLVLPGNLKCAPLSSFVCALTSQVYQTRENYTIIITCTNSNSGTQLSTDSITSSIAYTNTAKKTSRVSMDHSRLNSLSCDVQNYRVDFCESRSEIQRIFECYNNSKNSRVILNLF